jgi:predicted  nucleic acid-binding Zn-ribbon protein
MTSTRQLYSLQELDLALARVESQKAEAEQEMDMRMAWDVVEAALQAERDQLQELQKAYRLDQLEADSPRQRSAELDAKLYSGAITNPRELESLQQEASNVRAQVERMDAALLELSLKTEESQRKCAALEKQLSDARAAWESRQVELREQLKRLTAEQEKIAAQRAQLAASVEPAELSRYERLRKAKGGQAVAKVERGLCQACRMSLPTQQLQRVRTGRQTVLCSSCGRMLFIS